MNTSAKKLFAVAAAAAVLATAGCSYTVEDLPLPKPGVEGESYTVHAVMSNALNLPDRAHVKIGGSDVGVVTAIGTSNFQANIDMQIRKDITLPQGTRVELRQATPLGDVYVALQPPADDAGKPQLKDGDTIGIELTSAGATVEDLLASVSLLLDGGAIQHIGNIASEVGSMVAGRGPVLAHLITELTNVVTVLNQRTSTIDATLKGLDSTLATLNQRRSELGAIAETLPQMVGAIAENNRSIGDLVQRLSVATDAVGDFSRTTGPQVNKLLTSTTTLMDALTQTKDTLSPMLQKVHEATYGFDNSNRGQYHQPFATIKYLAIGAAYDPGSRLPDGTDATALVGSLAQTFQIVCNRVTGSVCR